MDVSSSGTPEPDGSAAQHSEQTSTAVATISPRALRRATASGGQPLVALVGLVRTALEAVLDVTDVAADSVAHVIGARRPDSV